MYKHGKRDENHKRIVNAARNLGCTVLDLGDVGGGCPDILVGFRGENVLVEIKDGSKFPSQRYLTEDQKEFFRSWRGWVVKIESVVELVRMIDSIRKTKEVGA